MTHRISLALALGVLAAAFALPASAAASSDYRAKVIVDHCQFTGGAHGRGYVKLKVELKEVGKSGTTHFVVSGKRQESSGLGFSTVETYPPQSSESFPNDSNSYSTDAHLRYDFTKHDELTERLVMTVKFKSGNGTTLAKRTVKGTNC
jgi:hypothetical protein